MRHSASPYSVAAAVREAFAITEQRSILGHRSNLAQRLRNTPQARSFHDYFVTLLPSSSLAPDRSSNHNLPRAESKPHSGPARGLTNDQHAARGTTIVRIPLRSAKHHFGAGCVRGGRPYNEDTFQAGTIEMPAFAKRQPISLTRDAAQSGGQAAAGESGDPQVFYFGVFDGHGGNECSEFLRDRLHGYIEEAALLFGMDSSLQKNDESPAMDGGIMGEMDPEDLQKTLVAEWKSTVGGYFKRFRPQFFPAINGAEWNPAGNSSIETILSYAFLKADLDFTTAQAAKRTSPQMSSSIDDPVLSDRPLNDQDMLFHPERPASQNLTHRPPAKGSSPNLDAPIGGSSRFKGGSTASTALISTPTPTPFWHPVAPSTLITAHVGDTRILLCRTSDGKSVPVTSNHHPDLPSEASRLRRYATAFSTDSFGDQRVLGLANTRAFGDIASKRVGVSAEPEIVTTQLAPAEYSFVVLVSDGVSGHLSDQEIVDIVKEERTPASAATALINFAVETNESEGGADNATALVVRLGGWERRSEGGDGSFGTKERRDFRKRDAEDPRSRRQ
ncbi:hypothetical protein AMS68_002091 [Peltaster fructicola]|uniref:PPM-type phosphatase domain-containing protein n=1 Tax=Peltaster fructicola TaxID=286661 RepID=A0A6H0XPB7_9PEZI|nr:hypothetical protein AMS68_002091 [Peltaster fructicola]